MPRLQNSLVLRGGVTARHWSHGTSNIRVYGNTNGMSLSFKLASKGGGFTDIQATIDPSDFPEIVNQMMKSDRDGALRVMSAAIAEHHS